MDALGSPLGVPTPPMLVLVRSDLPELLDLDALIDAVADATADLSAGRITVPDRTDAIVPERATALARPGGPELAASSRNGHAQPATTNP